MKNKRIINREISWLSFNERVLQEAADQDVPIVERIRFLGIFSNNLDEFFKVRVATIKRMIDVEARSSSLDLEKPKELLNKIQQIVIGLQKKFESIYQELRKDLEKERIILINEKQLTRKKEEFVHKYFIEQVLPVLTPIMLHNVKAFPNLKDRSIYLAVKMSSNNPKIANEYAIIEVPTERLGRFLLFPIRTRKYLILLDDVIRYGLKIVFSHFHYDHFEAYTIKLTRDAELDIDNDLSKSFLEKIDESVQDRSEGQPVRFVFDEKMPDDLLNYLIQRLNLDEDDNLIPGGRYHNFKDFMKFPNLGKKHLQYEVQLPLNHPRIHPGKSLFDVISEKDLLLHFPYQKFNHYINWLREASMDPKVTSIKTTLYRVASDSAVINALINAALNGKNVTVNIELQARFDEKSNIYWSKRLEEVGAKVTFGIRGLKVHSKLTLISRIEDGRTVNYAAIGTGNFHEGTAKVYSDLLLITKDKYIAAEVWKVFDFFHNTFKNYSFKRLMVSPNYQRKRLNALIDNEIENAKNGKPAYIILKVNSLVDINMIKRLYLANNGGVKIQLIIRGTCSLVPGIPGQSENIEAISIVDKYLEHSRIFVFCNGGDPLYYISSADWMTRNIDNRIEVSAPVYDKDLQEELQHIIDVQLSDNVKSRIINETQSNPYKKQTGERAIRSQQELYNYYRKLSEKK
ncbi:MAG: polyphosphate kinase 1 [Bacteroidales bacterium]|nr:polyphosphate kinase 1 [Bacteroidales bacterium]MCB8999363.1 polyphosphate kinase 1 [Bacteroidales bacterium]MCB9013394.1 polyphosphate kinase 1 [Bacteroidales bacterium]